MAKSAAEIREAFEQLRGEVDASGGVRSIDMASLRNMVGAGRLADGPLEQIRLALESRGLKASGLSNWGEDYTLVYDTTSPIGRIIAAATASGPDSDKELLSAVTGFTGGADPRDEELNELRDMLDQVRAIVSVSQ